MGSEWSRLDPSYQRHSYSFACTGCYQHTPTTAMALLPRLIAGTNLLNSQLWIAWYVRAWCTYITFVRGYYTIESKSTSRNVPTLIVARPTRYQWTNCVVRKGPRNISLKVLSERGIEHRTLSTSSQCPNNWATEVSIFSFTLNYIGKTTKFSFRHSFENNCLIKNEWFEHKGIEKTTSTLTTPI